MDVKGEGDVKPCEPMLEEEEERPEDSYNTKSILLT